RIGRCLQCPPLKGPLGTRHTTSPTSPANVPAGQSGSPEPKLLIEKMVSISVRDQVIKSMGFSSKSGAERGSPVYDKTRQDDRSQAGKVRGRRGRENATAFEESQRRIDLSMAHSTHTITNLEFAHCKPFGEWLDCVSMTIRRDQSPAVFDGSYIDTE